MAANGFIVVVKISADMVHRAVPSAVADTCIGVMLTVLVFGQQHESSVDWTRTIADVRAGRGGPLVALEADI